VTPRPPRVFVYHKEYKVKILVTGGRGMLGSDLREVVLQAGHECIMTDINDLDVREYELVRRSILDIRPDVVLHLAALTDVDECERRPAEAYRTNTVGTHNVALACLESGATLVYIGTISIFGGSKCEPYTEFDIPAPASVYANSKYQAELIVQRLLQRHYIVRAGWMFGGGAEDKKFVAKIIELARTRDTLQIVDDKFGSPTYTVDFAAGILRLLETGLYGTYHMVNTGGFCSRFELAQAILEYAGIATCRLIPVSSALFSLPAPRPRMEAAVNYHLELRGLNWMRPWREALKAYIERLKGD